MMKIRMQDNSIRLRLSQTEVQDLLKSGTVESKVQFASAAQNTLHYAIKSCETAHLTAVFSGNRIEVRVPDQVMKDWAETDQIGMESEMPVSSSDGLRILVEKDFKCLTERKGEDESDNFPNPLESC